MALSDKGTEVQDIIGNRGFVYSEEDVKEAVKELKEVLRKEPKEYEGNITNDEISFLKRIFIPNFIKEIEKIFGEELTK